MAEYTRIEIESNVPGGEKNGTWTLNEKAVGWAE